MNLLIDAGNTRIKWALANGGNWLDSGNLPVEQASGLAQFFADCFDRLGVDPQNMKVFASNVAGEEVTQHIRNIDTGQQPEFIVARKEQCGVHNCYSNPAQLGSDRWAALITAWHLVHGECLVVCCGTATTIDALSGHGEFLGGLILPGVELMQRSLHHATAQLQPAQGQYTPFPSNTADALFSGAIQASCGAIERQHTLLGNNAPVLLSGGAAAQLQAHLRHVTDKTTSHSTRPSKDAGQVAGYGEASRLRDEVRCGHSRTGEHRSTVSWSHIVNLPVQIVDNLVLQGLQLIAQKAGA